jgi:hypothetical protein
MPPTRYEIIDRMNAAAAALTEGGTRVGENTVELEKGDALRALAVHSGMSVTELAPIVHVLARGGLQRFMEQGAVTEDSLHGLVSQAVLAGIFIGQVSDH